jgi:hypothetical protein
MTFFFKVSHFFEKNIKNNISWLNLTFLDLVLKEEYSKMYFSKKSLKNFRTLKFEAGKKNIPLKIFEISLEKLLKKIFLEKFF